MYLVAIVSSDNNLLRSKKMKLLFCLFIIVSLWFPLIAELEVGDFVAQDFSWTDDSEEVHSIYELTASGKVVYIFWGEQWCPFSNMAAALLADWYPSQDDNEMYLISDENWNNGLPYSEEINAFFSYFDGTYVPLISIIGAFNQLLYSGPSAQEAIDLFPEALSSFNEIITLSEIEDIIMDGEESYTIELTEYFACYNYPLTYQLYYTYDPAIIYAHIDDAELLITSNTISGNTNLAFEVFSPLDSLTVDFLVTVNYSPPDLTIYDIQYTIEPGLDNNYPSPYLGESVTLTGIVTATGFNNNPGNFFMSMPAGGLWSSIYVYNSGNNELQRGDLVEVTGTVAEYFGQTELINISYLEVIDQGIPMPPAYQTTTEDVSQNEALESVLVEVQEVTVTSIPNALGEWYVADNSNSPCQIDNTIFTLNSVNPPIVVNLGDTWEFIRGVVFYSYEEYQIEPRDAEDLKKFEYAVHFNGNSFLRTNWLETFHYPTGNMTIEAWIRPQQWGDIQEIIYGINTNDNSTIQFRIDGDGQLLYGEHPDWNYVASDGPCLVLGVWNHIAVARSDGLCILYVNGVPIADNYVMEGISPNNLYLGARGTDFSRFFYGDIDEVRIWSTARSESQIVENMHNTVDETDIFLRAYWQLNEGNGTWAYDLTSWGHSLLFGNTFNPDEYDPAWLPVSFPHALPLVANFTSNTNYGYAPLQVQFIDRSTSVATSWAWDFQNDGFIDSYQQYPQYTYQQPGTYSVALTVSDGENTHTKIRTDYMTVNELSYPAPTNLNVTNQGFATWSAPQNYLFSDNFEDYLAGEFLAAQTGDEWNTWDGSTGGATDALVTSEYALSGENSVIVNGSSDIIHHFDDYSSGHYQVTANILVAPNFGGYFNLLHSFSPTEWGLEVWLSNNGSGWIRAGGNETGYFSYSSEQWMEFMIDINLDSDWVIFYLNGIEIHAWQWSLDAFTGNAGIPQLAAINFFSHAPAGSTPRYFFDDVSLKDISENRELTGYNIYLDNQYEDSTPLQYYHFSNLQLGNTYSAGVTAIYENIYESDIIEAEFVYSGLADSYALAFDGVDDFVDCGNSESLNLNSSLTLEAWINPADWGEMPELGFGRIIDKGHYMLFLCGDGSNTPYNNHSLVFILDTENGSFAPNTPAYSLNLNTWQHIAVTYDGSEETHIYINGVEQPLSGIMPSSSIVDNSQNALLIGESPNQGRAFYGLMDEIRIWNTTRTQENITDSMYDYLQGSEYGLAAYWKMNDGFGQLITDHSIYGNNGRLGNSQMADEADPYWTTTLYPYDAPFAEFFADITSGYSPLTVQFTDYSSNGVSYWEWDFDNDGFIDSYDQNPQWTYDDPGLYSVALKVTKDEETNTKIKYDYISVDELPFLPTPRNLAVEVFDATQALFNWDAPQGYETGQWIHYDDGTNTGGIGYTDGSAINVAIRWDAGDLADFNGMEITKICFFPKVEQVNFIFKAWTGDGYNQIYSQPLSHIAETWNEFILDEPIVIDAANPLWIGYSASNYNAGTYPCGSDSGPAVSGYGDMVMTNEGEWLALSQISGYSINWNLQAFVAGATRSLPIPQKYTDKVPTNSAKSSLIAMNTSSRDGIRLNRGLLGYNVYLNDELIIMPLSIATEFLFTELIPETEYIAGVIAVYDEGDSDIADIMFDTPALSLNADFTADTNYSFAGSEIQFTDLSTGIPATWEWDFQSDGEIDSYQQNPLWIYNDPGVYSVTLTISDNQNNSHSVLKEDYIIIKPDWNINPPDYEYNGSMWGVVYLEDTIVNHTEGILAGFVDDEIRCLASFDNGSVIDYTNIPQFNHVAFIPMLYSNQTSGEIVSFKYWDPYVQDVQNIDETIEFIADMVIGDGFNPFQWHTTTDIVISKALTPGWNWFSINVAADNMSINNVLASLGDCGTSIKNQLHSSIYYEGMGWFGSLQTINNISCYKMLINEPAILEISGTPVAPEQTTYNLSAGWNWISYAPQLPVAINYALSSLDYGINIKNQIQSSTYYPGMGWFGTLSYMQPLEGYMLKLSNSEEFFYPVPESSMRFEPVTPVFSAKEARWRLNPQDYEYNGVIIAKIIPAEGFSPDDYLMAVFHEEECRGIASHQSCSILDYSEELGSIYHMPMVFSNQIKENNLIVKLYNTSSKTTHLLDSELEFTADMLIGNWQEPLLIFAPTEQNQELIPPAASSLNCYPNPFNPHTNIKFDLALSGLVNLEIYNVKGQKVLTLLEEFMEAGSHSLIWNAIDQPSGVYLLQYSAPDCNITQKLILLK
jgi:PKD repeat protein